jgi:hypothetical protein
VGRAMASLVFALVSLGACGGDDSRPVGAERSSSMVAEGTEVPAFDATACEKKLGRFIEELQEIDSRLAVGLSYDEYGSFVADARVEYDKINFNSVTPECLFKVGVPAENALNDYVKAFKVWDRCFQRLGCDIDSIDPQLQKEWSQAETRLNSVDRRLQ